MQILRKTLLGLSLLLFTVVAHAEANPKVMVESAINQMLQELEVNKGKIAEDKQIVRGIVERVILPNMASNTIARRVMGKYARRASDEQKSRFAEAFKGYMIRFYSNAFAEYT
ncbi:MAG: ABC transporter substrate-binding protein, partial [Enterobacterales bacterium]|nr:ABC transporter substrate-binding protein [Enterobacterales bacterium]